LVDGPESFAMNGFDHQCDDSRDDGYRVIGREQDPRRCSDEYLIIADPKDVI